MVDCRSPRGFLKSLDGWLSTIFSFRLKFFWVIAGFSSYWDMLVYVQYGQKFVSTRFNFYRVGLISHRSIGVRQDNIHENKCKSWMRGATCMVTHNYLNIWGDSFCDANLSVTTIEQSWLLQKWLENELKLRFIQFNIYSRHISQSCKLLPEVIIQILCVWGMQNICMSNLSSRSTWAFTTLILGEIITNEAWFDNKRFTTFLAECRDLNTYRCGSNANANLKYRRQRKENDWKT